MIDIVRDVLERLDISQEQAEGSVGLLLLVAQQRLSADDFAHVAQAIPGVSDVILKAPHVEPPPRLGVRALWQGVRNYVGGPGALACVTDGYRQLGLPRRFIRASATAVLEYCQAQGATDAADCLRRAWKLRPEASRAAEIEGGRLS